MLSFWTDFGINMLNYSYLALIKALGINIWSAPEILVPRSLMHAQLSNKFKRTQFGFEPSSASILIRPNKKK